MNPLEVTAHVRAHIISGHRDRGRKAQHKSENTQEASPLRPASSHSLPSATADKWPEIAVFFDCETTTELDQQLLFGVYRVDRRGQPGEEGIFMGDGLSETEKKSLSDYAQAAGVPLRTRREFLKNTLFYWAYRLHHRVGSSRHMRGAVVGFNPAFDLSRLAFNAAPTKNTRALRGGWSFDMLDYDSKDGCTKRDIYSPSIQIRHLGNGALFSFTKPTNGKAGDRRYSYAVPEGSTDDREVPNYAFRGHFLDCKTLADALSGDDLSLERACRRFGVPYRSRKVPFGAVTGELITHCHEDVEATAGLYYALLAEYRKWDIDLPPNKVYSGASLGKGVLGKAGITGAPPVVPGPSLPKGESPGRLAGYSRAAFYAGRMECPIRWELMPVVPLDGRSFYGHIAYLIKLWRLVIAEHVVAEDATEDARQLLERVTPAELLQPEPWREINVLCLVAPECDVLPLRTHESEVEELGTWLPEIIDAPPPGLWYGLPDVIASKVRTGRAPAIVRAIRLSPRGLRPGLASITLRGGIAFDPTKDDLFAVALAERARLLGTAGTDKDNEARRTADALKIVLNGTAFGIWGEEHNLEPPIPGRGKAQPVRIYAGTLQPQRGTIPRTLTRGDYYCPVLATLVTSGARLMLGLIEHTFEEAGSPGGEVGGTIANVVTDGLAVVATETGGLIPCPAGSERTETGEPAIRALSYGQLDELRARFAPLSPFGEGFLRVEGSGLDASGGHRPVFFYGVSTLRYCLFDSRGRALKPSAHVIGTYAPPGREGPQTADWLAEAWEYILATATDENVQGAAWLDQVAFVRRTASHPTLLKRLDGWNAGKPYREQAKPFNFWQEPARRLLELGPDTEAGPGRMDSGLIVIGRDPDYSDTWICWDPREVNLAYLYNPREIEEGNGLAPNQRRHWAHYDAWLNEPQKRCSDHSLYPPGEVAGATWRQILEDYASHPERKLRAPATVEDPSFGGTSPPWRADRPDGGPCTFFTRGLLVRPRVRIVTVEPIARNKGLRVTEPQTAEWPAALEWARRAYTKNSFARKFGYSPRMAAYILSGKRRPSAEKMAEIIAAYRQAREGQAPQAPPLDEWPAILDWVRAKHTTVSFAKAFDYSPRMARSIFRGTRQPGAERMAEIIAAYREAREAPAVAFSEPAEEGRDESTVRTRGPRP